MSRVIIIHGTHGSPDENWFPWLRDKVVESGAVALVPLMPTPEGQDIGSWTAAFNEQVGDLHSDTILVGHSLGVGFILDLLEFTGPRVRGCVLASAFVGKLGLPDFDELNRSFVCRQFNWDNIRARAGEVHIFHGEDDPYVPLSKSLEVATQLHVSPEVIPHGGHLNAEAGFIEFPQLWSRVEAMLHQTPQVAVNASQRNSP